MDSKIKSAWMIYLAGLPVTFILSSMIEDQLTAGSVIGYYAFYGLIIMAVFHFSHRTWRNRKEKLKKINK